MLNILHNPVLFCSYFVCCHFQVVLIKDGHIHTRDGFEHKQSVSNVFVVDPCYTFTYKLSGTVSI